MLCLSYAHAKMPRNLGKEKIRNKIKDRKGRRPLPTPQDRKARFATLFKASLRAPGTGTGTPDHGELYTCAAVVDWTYGRTPT